MNSDRPRNGSNDSYELQSTTGAANEGLGISLRQQTVMPRDAYTGPWSRDNVINAMYEFVCFESCERPDRERQLEIFAPDALMGRVNYDGVAEFWEGEIGPSSARSSMCSVVPCVSRSILNV